jgi:hypothetical protein
MRGAENVHVELFSLCGPKIVRRGGCRMRSPVTAGRPAVRCDAAGGVLLPISVTQSGYELLVGK